MTDKLKSTKWRKVLAEAHTGGMNNVIRSAIWQSHWAHLLTKGPGYVTLNVHSFREVGTAVDAAIELEYWDTNNKRVGCRFLNITL
ncbi:hypothetical protein CHUUTOTORO_01570 [Serratia phage vB_SmaM-ChuuTotoro]|nr:hypothetical protein CHUUTOTORO_01570 [Serratia phage vB_SmaM-ChuuTotoro]